MVTSNQITLYAYTHTTKSGNVHLRVKQPFFGDDNFKAHMRRVGSPANWNQQSAEWDYPLTPAAIQALKFAADSLGCQLQWSDELRDYAEYQIQLDKYEEQVRLAIERSIRKKEQLPPYMTNTKNGQIIPFYHQSISYHWALRTTGLLLAHEPGLGKTRSATDAAGGWYREGIIQPMTQLWRPESRAFSKPDQPPMGAWGIRGGILVVCPKVMIRTWATEMQQWQNMVALEITGGRKRKITRLGTVAHAHIINYENLNLILEMGNQYDAVIVDESHRCANRSTQTMNVLALSMTAKRRLLLTGTPVSNNLEAVFYQMLITDGGRSLGSSKTKFLEQYFNSEQVGNGQNKYYPRDGAIEEVSQKMSKSCYFLKKHEVLDLPERTHTPVYLEMTPDQARYYEQLRQDSMAYIMDAEVTIEMAATRMMRLAQLCQGHIKGDDGEIRHFTDTKTLALLEMLESYRGYKTIVWARFTYEIERLCQMLTERGIPHLRFDGSTPQNQRNAAVQQWNQDPNVRVFVGQLQMGIGITLHAAECAVPCANSIYLGLDFSYVNWIQSMDRIHRIGQRWHCSYSYLLTENGIDRRMYNALLAKQATADSVHKTGKDFYMSLLSDDTPALAMVD